MNKIFYKEIHAELVNRTLNLLAACNNYCIEIEEKNVFNVLKCIARGFFGKEDRRATQCKTVAWSLEPLQDKSLISII
jgi:hypothetical protein